MEASRVVIRDSSDDEFSGSIDFPDDILQMSPGGLGLSDALAKPTAIAEQGAANPKEPEEPEDPEFDPDLTPAAAIQHIKDIQTRVSSLAEQGIAIVGDMETMIAAYQHAVDQAVAAETKHKSAILAQWEEVKKDAQHLLRSVRMTVSALGT
ncbi:hypothetical protein EC988_005285 [Linderina pennispora]|nr:hypothetical protein EC988_005285 [Linderina pennispora]